MDFMRYSSEISGKKLRSFAMRELNEHQTEANEIFWSFMVSNSFASKIARDKKKDDRDFSTKDLFHASGGDARRIPPTVTKWVESSEKFEAWSRRSLLLSAASYLELYIKRATCSALLSKPMLLNGTDFDFDGMHLIKADKAIDVEKFTVDFVKGDWSSRSSALIRMFGSGMDQIEFLKSDLEKIRNDRNSVSHNFGRNISKENFTDLRFSDNAFGISLERLKKHLNVIRAVTICIDEVLMDHHIGAFEILRYYHENISNINEQFSHLNSPRRVQKFFHSTVGISFNQQYAKEMIEYYDSL